MKYQLPVYLYIAAIFIGSSIPGPSMPSAPVSTDKVAHLVEYGILGFLLSRLFASGRMSVMLAVILTIFCAAALGGLDESYQGITSRHPSVYDWLFDCLGAAIASCSLALYTWSRKARE